MNESFRQILVHLDAGEATAHRLRAARQIAQAHGAAVAALYAATPYYLTMAYAGEGGAGAVADLVEIDNQLRARARRAFDEACASPGPTPAWAEARDIPVDAVLAGQALYADLLVLGQHDPAAATNLSVPPGLPEAVVVASGKPALVVPYIGWPRSIGDIAAIAWKPTREAGRAVAAAMPLLQRARQVHVLTWGEPDPSAVQGEPLDLERYLKLHGVEAIWHREGKEPEQLGELLLSRTADLDADLLVMGCYGHSRARELVLGGASRTVLRAMTLPVLMAH